MEDGRLVLSGPSSELRADDITEVVLGSGSSVGAGRHRRQAVKRSRERDLKSTEQRRKYGRDSDR